MSDTYGMTYEEEAEHLREIVVPELKEEIERLRAVYEAAKYYEKVDTTHARLQMRKAIAALQERDDG